MADLICTNIRPAAEVSGAFDTCELTYEGRFVRRKMLQGKSGVRFLLDLARATSLNAGDAFELSDGRLVAVVAAAEDVFEVSGPEVTRYAWHIGNRHAPAQILPDTLLIKPDPVLRDMLQHLGAIVVEAELPFTPEGGAYGHGRTMGHSHDDPVHDHDHGHEHDHVHH